MKAPVLVSTGLAGLMIIPLCGVSAAQAAPETHFKVLHSFGNAPNDGWQPWGSPTLVNGRLWGRTTYGGSPNQSAVIWSMIPDQPKSYRVEHRFGRKVKYESGGRGTDLANPHHDWMRIGPDGRTLFGAALWGGRGGYGGAFSYDTLSGKYRVLRTFDGLTPTNLTGSPTDAANPHSNAVPITVKNKHGKQSTILVGMSAFGGANGTGSLYRMTPRGERFRILHSFVPATGEQPHGFVIQQGHTLYGLTRLGGIVAPEHNFPHHSEYHPYKNGNGVLFKLNLRTGKYKILHSFSYAGPLAAPTLPGGVVDGAVPDHGGMVLRHGRLWGVTTAGGVNGGGVLFSIKPKGNGYRVDHSFGAPDSSSDQTQPHGTLMPGPNGVLYGLGSAGGSASSGGVFSINPKTGKYRNVYSFPGGSKGAFGIDDPVVTRLRDGRVVLYGMTKNGGAVTSNFTPTPVAPDWDPSEPTLANGTIWRLVLGKKKR